MSLGFPRGKARRGFSPRTVILLFALLCFPRAVFGGETFLVPEVGVSIRFPDGWWHDEKDGFGYVIHAAGESRGKVRIHLTEYKNMSPEQAMRSSVAKVDKRRADQGLRPDRLLALSPIVTKSGLAGQKAVLGTEPDSAYLNRYYFPKPDGTIFCVCVYFYGDASLARDGEARIVESLSLTQ